MDMVGADELMLELIGVDGVLCREPLSRCGGCGSRTWRQRAAGRGRGPRPVPERWERLVDEHGAQLSHGYVRHHVTGKSRDQTVPRRSKTENSVPNGSTEQIN